ncbi:sensor histidine kinase [Thalassospira australica]|uniref:sensor histidine kinase n=1 Tax=Thalassospira australica TaxID=1528106 RepID=UPI003850ED7A
MTFVRISWPKSLKGQFNLALAGLTLLILAIGFIGIRSLDETVNASGRLSEDRLTHMEDAQTLVRTALLLERESRMMQMASEPAEMQSHYNQILVHLDEMDNLVSNLGQAGTNISVLAFQHTAQLFRGTIHILAKLHDQALNSNIEESQNEVLATRLDLFNRNLAQQGQELLAASEALSNDFTSDYRQSVQQLTQKAENRRFQVLGLLAISLVVAWFISTRFLGKVVISRLQKVSHYLRKAGEAPSKDAGVPVTGDDEIGEMARAVEQYMKERQQLAKVQQEAAHTARFIAVGQLAAGIAHEINTPAQYIGDNLQFIRTIAENMAKDPACSSWQDDLTEVTAAISDSREGIKHISGIVTSMREFSHPGITDRIEADINRALENALTVSQNQWKHVATLEQNFDPNLRPLLCDIGKLNQVFLNLIVNAAHAIEKSGKPYPGKIFVTTTQNQASIEVRISDTGTGIDEALCERIFDPFFTTKEPGQGTGQGLAICQDIVVQKHGGTIDVTGNEGEGAEFTIRLPIISPTSISEADKED